MGPKTGGGSPVARAGTGSAVFIGQKVTSQRTGGLRYCVGSYTRADVVALSLALTVDVRLIPLADIVCGGTSCAVLTHRCPLLKAFRSR